MGKVEESKQVSDVSSEAQASKLLEQALIEMDGIISGNNTAGVISMSTLEDETNPALITAVSRKLALILQKSTVILPPEPEVRDALCQWIQMSPYEPVATKSNSELQIQVLSEQIEAQSEKILDLQEVLQEKQKIINEMERNLQKEFLSRSALETQKQELLQIVHKLNVAKSSLETNDKSRNYQTNNCIYCLSAKSTPAAENNSLSGKYHLDKVFKADSACHIEVFHSSLPRQQYLAARQDVSSGKLNDACADVDLPDGNTFGQVSSHVGIRARGQSVPNLENEKMYLDEAFKTQSPDASNKARGIWKILNLMRRSGSGNLHDLSSSTMLTRGGVRATTGGRLGWSEPHLSKEETKPLEEWHGEDICKWLQDLGLDQYVPDAKKWLKSDQQLQNRNIFDLEHHLPIKNVLHRKKLHLAITDLQDRTHSNLHLHEAGNLDTSWILRWLDDIGLPQHKEQFLVNKIDGRMLHHLTFDDLTLLHITSMLHVTSIKRGVQVLRQNDFDPNCLQRRSLSEDVRCCVASQDISLWTTHRVMEWLRSVDLAEYAPNLRGAGVHGGLIVYEAKFTSDLLASLLSIPPGKTLLRRHLSTRFKELLGSELIQKKRDAAAVVGYIPLTPSTKFKVPKKSQFSLKLKSNKKTKYDDLVCPLDTGNLSDTEEGAASSGCIS